MAKKLASRTAQYPLFAECVLNYNDWVTDSVTGQKATLGSTVALADSETVSGLINGKNTTVTFDAIPLPVGAVIISGEVLVETAWVGPTATVSVGIAGATTKYTTTSDMAATTRVAFVITTNVELASNGGENLRLTMAIGNTDATAGKVRIRVMYTIDGRMNETQLT
jgi:hypothetical protein